MNEHQDRRLPPPGQGGAPDFPWLLFSFDGRIGREVFWLGIGLIWSVLLVALGVVARVMEEDTAGLAIIALGIAALWAEIALLVKRLHDRNLPGFWAILAFIPFVGILWIILAGIMPGDAGANGYGAGPDQRK